MTTIAKSTGPISMACSTGQFVTPVHKRCQGKTHQGPCTCPCHRGEAPPLGPKR